MTLCRLTEERALSRFQLMFVHSPFLRYLARPLLPKSWTAGSFKTTGDVEAQRIALQNLGTQLGLLSSVSFLFKAASVAGSYFARDTIAASAQLESILFLATTLTVQAVPSAVTLLLLSRFHFSRVSDRSGTLMQTLLSLEGAPVSTSHRYTSAASWQGQQVPELVAENARLQVEVQQNRTNAERVSQESENLRMQIAELRQSNEKAQEQIALLRAEMAKR